MLSMNASVSAHEQIPRLLSAEYGPYTTIYNRFNHWSRQGIWLAMFKAVTGSASLFGTASIDTLKAFAHECPT